jgi:hypothetical protein
VAVQSIRTAVQVGDVTRNHLLVAPCEMPLAKMNLVRKLDHVAEKVRSCAEAFYDPGNLFAAGRGAPEIVGRSDIAGGLRILGDANLRGAIRFQRLYFLGEVEALPDFLICHFYLAYNVQTFMSEKRPTGVHTLH